MRLTFCLLVSIYLLLPSAASALTWDEIVTTKFVREHPGLVSVAAAHEQNGMISFTIGLKFKQPRYVVAHMKVRDGSRTLSESHTPFYTTVDKSTFRFSIPRELVQEKPPGSAGGLAAFDSSVVNGKRSPTREQPEFSERETSHVRIPEPTYTQWECKYIATRRQKVSRMRILLYVERRGTSHEHSVC